MKDDRMINLRDAENIVRFECGEWRGLAKTIIDNLEALPSAQLAQDLTKGCTDTISRAAVVDTIEGVDWYHQNKNGEMVHGANSAEDQAWYKAEDIYKAVESVPSAQRWIPCKTALPSEYDNYLITTEDGMVVFGVYDPREKQWCRYDSIKSWWIDGIKVLAWQYVPRPWEGGQDEQN